MAFRIQPTAILFLALPAAAALAAPLAGQAPPPALYTAAQADEGAKVFAERCVSCHGGDLAGKDDAPPLAGAYFASSWGGRKVSELIEFVQGNMPFDQPGSLNEESYLRVVAYVLARNGAPAGPTRLAQGATGAITLAKH